MGTDCADDSAKRDGGDNDEKTPVALPYYKQLLFLRDTMTTREQAGNFLSGHRAIENVRQLLRQETAERILRGISQNQFEDIDFDQTSDHPHFYPAPPVSIKCSPLLPESSSSLGSCESAAGSLETAAESLRSAASSLQSLEPSLASMSAMQPPKKMKDDDDSLLIEHLRKLTNSLDEQDGHHHFALSLVRSMREVKKEHHLDMRMKIMEVIKQFKDLL
ncbi:uncharacterized protein LOC144149775 [Haemaphysalis longicornis]